MSGPCDLFQPVIEAESMHPHTYQKKKKSPGPREMSQSIKHLPHKPENLAGTNGGLWFLLFQCGGHLVCTVQCGLVGPLRDGSIMNPHNGLSSLLSSSSQEYTCQNNTVLSCSHWLLYPSACCQGITQQESPLLEVSPLTFSFLASTIIKKMALWVGHS